MEPAKHIGINVSPIGLVSRKDAAKALLMKPKTLCEWAKKGIGPNPVRVGGRIFYKWSELQSFVANNSN